MNDTAPPAALTSELELLARQVAAMTGPEDRHDEAERAAECAEKAEALRASVAGTVEAAQAELAEIEAETARRVNTARAKLTDVQSRAHSVERAAAAHTDTGRAYRIAANLAQQAREARQEAERLAAERLDHLGTADALSARLSDLRAQQRAAETDLEAAKAAVDVEAAGEAQQRLSGITAVMPALSAQYDAAAGRARAIGTEETGGTYAQTLARIAAYLVERAGALDAAEPERVEARRAANPVAALLQDIAALPTAAREEILGSWFAGQQEQQPTITVQGTAVVRRNA